MMSMVKAEVVVEVVVVVMMIAQSPIASPHILSRIHHERAVADGHSDTRTNHAVAVAHVVAVALSVSTRNQVDGTGNASGMMTDRCVGAGGGGGEGGG